MAPRRRSAGQLVELIEGAGGPQPLGQPCGLLHHRCRGQRPQLLDGRLVDGQELLEVRADRSGPVDVLRGRPEPVGAGQAALDAGRADRPGRGVLVVVAVGALGQLPQHDVRPACRLLGRPRFAQVAPPTPGRAEVQRASRVGGPQRPVRGEAGRDPVRRRPGQQTGRDQPEQPVVGRGLLHHRGHPRPEGAADLGPVPRADLRPTRWTDRAHPGQNPAARSAVR